MKHMLFVVLVLMSVWGSACTSTENTSTPEIKMEADMTFQITSDAFANGQSIPAKYSCIGKNISPALAWNEPPVGTQSLALIVDDPDAPMGTWVHWVLFNIKPDVRSLQEDLPITILFQLAINKPLALTVIDVLHCPVVINIEDLPAVTRTRK